MTGVDDHNFPLLNRAAEKYSSIGFEYFNPAAAGLVEGWGWVDYLKADIPELCRCDGIVMLSGRWLESKGCMLERGIADDLGLFIIEDDRC